MKDAKVGSLLGDTRAILAEYGRSIGQPVKIPKGYVYEVATGKVIPKSQANYDTSKGR